MKRGETAILTLDLKPSFLPWTFHQFLNLKS
jgi:hypothetical protein